MSKMMCILSDGFEELEAIGVIAIWRRAGIQVDVYALDNIVATGRFDITISNIKELSDANIEDYDALFLPGGPHYAKLERSQQVQKIIRYFIDTGKVVSAICAAPTILGRMGLLEGKQFTCFTSMKEDFKGIYIDDYVAQDGNIITGRSAAAVIDFAFSVVEKLEGKELCEEVKNAIYYYHEQV